MKLQRWLMVAVCALALSATGGLQAQAPFVENFDNFAALAGAGWTFTNNSVSPVAAGAWRQGATTSTLNPPPSGVNGSFVTSSFNATGSTATTGANINDWMLTPSMILNNGDNISFFTRTFTGDSFPERMQVRITTTGPSTNVGVNDTDVGVYTTLLLDINPSLLQPAGSAGAYPGAWTQFNIPISGLAGPTNTSIAFRHFVADGGSNGANSDAIGVDSLTVTFAAVPEPATIALIGTVLAGGLYQARRMYARKVKNKATKYGQL